MTLQGDHKVLTQDYSHLNLGALSLWYQVTEKPDFYKAFQALSKIRQQFVDETQFKLIAYHAYNYFFNNQNTAINMFLAHLFDKDTATKIYSNPVLGMDSVTKLFYWFQACSSTTDVNAVRSRNAIIANFKAQSIDLTDKIDALLGTKSIFSQIYVTLSQTIQSAFGMHNGMDNDALFQLQWSSLSIVESDRLKLSASTPTVHSFKDLDPDNIYFYGEFAYYVTYIQKKADETPLTQQQTIAYFTLSPTYGNFMNPANLQDFFDKYSEGNYGAILKRF